MTDELLTQETARSSAQEREAPRHDVTVRQASLLFAQFGVPRSPRSVQGFCKDGHIDAVAVKGPNGDRYLINRESIERYATELKQIDEIAKIGVEDDSALLREPARESAQERASTEQPASVPDVTIETHSGNLEEMQKLRDENMNLRIDNMAKERVINYLAGENRNLVAAVGDVNYRLGASETLVRQLEAPREAARSGAQEREAPTNAGHETPGGDAPPGPVGEGSDAEPIVVVATPPEPVVPTSQPRVPKRSLFGKMFGGKS